MRKIFAIYSYFGKFDNKTLERIEAFEPTRKNITDFLENHFFYKPLEEVDTENYYLTHLTDFINGGKNNLIYSNYGDWDSPTYYSIETYTEEEYRNLIEDEYKNKLTQLEKALKK